MKFTTRAGLAIFGAIAILSLAACSGAPPPTAGGSGSATPGEPAASQPR